MSRVWRLFKSNGLRLVLNNLLFGGIPSGGDGEDLGDVETVSGFGVRDFHGPADTAFLGGAGSARAVFAVAGCAFVVGVVPVVPSGGTDV